MFAGDFPYHDVGRGPGVAIFQTTRSMEFPKHGNSVGRYQTCTTYGSESSFHDRGTTRSQLVGGFNHLEKYESQWEGLSHILWKTKHVPNHQPVNNLPDV